MTSTVTTAVAPFLLAIALALVPPGVPAQALSQRGREGRGATGERFRNMDQNGDGAISRAEWRGSERSFLVHDWNHDGVLAGDELREPVRQAQRADPGDFDHNDTFNDWSAARFTAMDRNRDGRIARTEWTSDPASFRRADRNRDGVLTRGEFLGGDFDDDRGDPFDFLDVDGNNRVTRDEWHASPEAFAWLDDNHDGTLTRLEVEGSDAGSETDLFARLDRNRDARVSRTEWQWSRASFDQFDVNHDNAITRREMAGSPDGATADTATVSVGGLTRWIDTGLYVDRADMVRVQASGSVQMSADAADVADPRGSRTNRLAADAPMARELAGALIGRVDQGAPFLIGARATPIRMPDTGRLFLSVNDDHLDDNRGEFLAAVSVQRTSR